jgi:hypothetical protein
MDEYGCLQVTAWLIAIGTAVLLVWVEARHPMRAHFALHVWLAAPPREYFRPRLHFFSGIGVWLAYLRLVLAYS